MAPQFVPFSSIHPSKQMQAQGTSISPFQMNPNLIVSGTTGNELEIPELKSGWPKGIVVETELIPPNPFPPMPSSKLVGVPKEKTRHHLKSFPVRLCLIHFSIISNWQFFVIC